MYNYTCLSCQKQFSTYDKIRAFCSRKCSGIYKTNDYNFQCEWCSKEFRGRRYKEKVSKFCSMLCRDSFLRNPQKLFDNMKSNYEKHVIRNGNECWGWNGPLAKHGYALARFNRKIRYASRIAWMIHNGVDSIPKGYFICHHCDNPICSNITHLWLGTPKDNMQDKIKKGRSNHLGKASAKLTEEQIKDIKTRLSNGESGIFLSQVFNVSQRMISNIKTKKIWEHVI